MVMPGTKGQASIADYRHLGRDHARQIMTDIRERLARGEKLPPGMMASTVQDETARLAGLGCTAEEIEAWVTSLDRNFSRLANAFSKRIDKADRKAGREFTERVLLAVAKPQGRA